MKIQEDVGFEVKTRTDEGEELVWIPIDEIPNSDIKPSFIKDYIREIINGDKKDILLGRWIDKDNIDSGSKRWRKNNGCK